MELNINGQRLELTLSKQKALELIKILTAGVAKAEQTGSAWHADSITVTNFAGRSVDSRITIRVEDKS